MLLCVLCAVLCAVLRAVLQCLFCLKDDVWPEGVDGVVPALGVHVLVQILQRPCVGDQERREIWEGARGQKRAASRATQRRTMRRYQVSVEKLGPNV